MADFLIAASFLLSILLPGAVTGNSVHWFNDLKSNIVICDRGRMRNAAGRPDADSRRGDVIGRALAVDGRPVQVDVVAVLRRSPHLRPARPHRRPLHQRVIAIQLKTKTGHRSILNGRVNWFVRLLSRVHASKLLVRLGQSDIPGRAQSNASGVDVTYVTSNTDPDGFFYGVKKTILHSKYDPPSHLHDIAILRLDRLVHFTADIQRICLPSPSINSLDGQDAYVAGWGTLDFMGASSASLREVRVPIWNNEDCQKAIGRNVFNSTLCAGGTRKPADACQVLRH